MAGPNRSMLYSFLLFVIILSLLEMYRGKLASSELLTIAGGFISSLIFLALLTLDVHWDLSGNMWCENRMGCCYLSRIGSAFCCGHNTSRLHHDMLAISFFLNRSGRNERRRPHYSNFLFSVGFLFEVNKLSGMMVAKSELKPKLSGRKT